LLVGVDANLPEINVTSPAGIARLGGTDVAVKIWRRKIVCL
jgi:hypothetical protein